MKPMKHSVTIVGGGLAGLSAAVALLRRGFAVRILEAHAQPGGKARAEPFAGGFHGEHGYHIFPTWYVNVWRLVDELGIGGNFTGVEQAYSLGESQFPRFRSLDHGSPRSLLRRQTPDALSMARFLLSAFGMLDLASQRYDRRIVDDISVAGFVRSRFYRSDHLARELGGYVFRATSGASHEISATTVHNVMRYWLRSPPPLVKMAATNLHEAFIEPLCREVERLGGSLETERTLLGIELDGRVARRIRVRDAAGDVVRHDVESLVLTLPPGKLLGVLDDAFYAASPGLSSLSYLRAAPMASMSILFKESATQLTSIVKEHVYLEGSTYHISFIDQWATWKGAPGRLINFVASDFTPLKHLSPAAAQAALLAELQRYLPFSDADIEAIDFRPNVDEPLTLNTPGSWPHRPTAKTGVKNVYLAGDSCQSSADLVCMESAVETGLRAAGALIDDLGHPARVEVLSPKVPPRWALDMAKAALLPAVAPAAIFARRHPPGP